MACGREPPHSNRALPDEFERLTVEVLSHQPLDALEGYPTPRGHADAKGLAHDHAGPVIPAADTLGEVKPH